ncbi:hypothetical protein, partial [Rhabdaerophilum calidifontis]|uniref:hypothetical protein n=1 Tax=Rhabdaerophilum calidifontis TaxID=2604328 RepID=UPI0019811D00
LKAGLWFRRGRLVMVSPVHGIMPISGRISTYPRCPDFPSQLCEQRDHSIGGMAAGDRRPNRDRRHSLTSPSRKEDSLPAPISFRHSPGKSGPPYATNDQFLTIAETNSAVRLFCLKY